MTATTFKIGDRVVLTEAARQLPRVGRMPNEVFVVEGIRDVLPEEREAAGHHQRVFVRGTESTSWCSGWMTAKHFQLADPPAMSSCAK